MSSGRRRLPAAFAGAVLATGLLNVLLLRSPRPYLFFGWIVGLATAAAALVPLTFDAELGAKVATSAINLAIGVCIGSILAGSAGAPPGSTTSPGRTEQDPSCQPRSAGRGRDR